jgi:hypothetical protein
MTNVLDVARAQGTSAETVSTGPAVSTLADVWQDETSYALIDAHWRQQRQLLVRTSENVAAAHREHYAERVADATEVNRRRGVLDLLGDLSGTYGVPWSDIASMLEISVPALRKWRHNSGITPENHHKLATLVAFFGVLGELVASPASWMAMRLVEGYNVTASDVYSSVAAGRLLDLAAGNPGASADAVLDALEPTWRDKWISRYEVFEAEDGEMSMRPRLA